MDVIFVITPAITIFTWECSKMCAQIVYYIV